MSLTRVCVSILLMFAFGSKAQTLTSIHNATVLITPGYTVSNNTSFTVTGSVKNTGTTTINNNVHVNLAIDTSSTATPKYHLRSTHSYSLTNFLPETIFPFSLNDIASNANKYKVAGNGTTVVIWTVVGFPLNDTTTVDSVKTTLYITEPPVGIEERDVWEKKPLFIQNPVTDHLMIRYNPEDYIRIDLTDTNGKIIELIWDSASTATPLFTVNMNYLHCGIYYIRCYHHTGLLIKKIIVQ